MGEPIKLYSPDGETVNVYTHSRANELISGGEWYATADEAAAQRPAQPDAPERPAPVETAEKPAPRVRKTSKATP